jgi:hypothetical protein
MDLRLFLDYKNIIYPLLNPRNVAFIEKLIVTKLVKKIVKLFCSIPEAYYCSQDQIHLYVVDRL